jgi:hypothetical protein
MTLIDSPCRNWVTSLRPDSTTPRVGPNPTGTPLRLTTRCSSWWMWIGCSQSAELFTRIHRSLVLRCAVKRKMVQSISCPLICHCPLPRSKRKVRVIRMGNSLGWGTGPIGANTASSGEAGTFGNATGSGSKLSSVTAPPTSRNSTS